MALDISGWTKFVWELIPDKRKILLAAMVIGLACLFLPWNWLVAMNVSEWVGNHRGTEWLVVGFCTLIFCFQGIEKGWKSLQKAQRVSDRLDHLTDEEQRTIRALLAGRQVICWPYQHDVVFLVRDGILWEMDCAALGNGQRVYGLTDYAKKKAVRKGLGVLPNTQTLA